MPIRGCFARQIFDSVGHPTIEVDLVTDLGLFRVQVPSALLPNEIEAVDLRDRTKNYQGLAVFNAVINVKDIITPDLVRSRLEVTQQAEIDQLLVKIDGTSNKSKLGGNAILGVSLAVAKAAAARRGVPLYQHIADLSGTEELVLPIPAFNVINGGVNAVNKLALQEFLILPTGASSFAEAMRIGNEVFYNLGKQITDKYGANSTHYGDEGGYAPNINDGKAALNLIKSAIEKAGFMGRVMIGIDAAASRFYKDGLYDLDFKNPRSDKSKWYKPEKLMALYQSYVKDFPIIAIEDPFHVDDWETWQTFVKKNPKLLVIGDDLTVSNLSRIKEAIERQACNTIVLKPNQIGTLTETIQAHLLAKSKGLDTIVSHRTGDNVDTFIADLAVGLSTGIFKAGAPCRSECLSKYNQIIRIEEELGQSAKYVATDYRRHKPKK